MTEGEGGPPPRRTRLSNPTQIGRYQILGLLGTGGMAEVFLGRLVGPSGFERPVVIKRILPHLARQKHFVDMFLDEARIVASIRHQNVVHVHELGAHNDELFLVMEYLEGESIAALARRLSSKKKLLSFGLAAHVIAEVCAGLHAAHALKDANGKLLGLVHRDVSPANIFVTYSGEVKILDFGIAVAADRVSRTDAGQVKGKYAYMSPEQCQGQPLDARSDVFSLGTVLYELSTCRRLFKRASDMLTLRAICEEDLTIPSKLVSNYPQELERVCLRALEKRREQRYQSAQELRRDLLELSRTLNQGKIPEESLSRVMHKLFADRIDEKRALLNRVQSGDEVTSVPAAEVDEAIELPSIVVGESAQHGIALSEMVSAAALPALDPVAPTALPMVSDAVAESSRSVTATALRAVTPLPRPPNPLKKVILPALVGLTGLILAGVWWSQPPKASPQPVVAPTPPVQPPPPVVAPIPQITEVNLQFDTDPPGATVRIGEKLYGRTPISVKVDKSAEKLDVELTLDGYLKHVERVTPDMEQRFRLVLERERKISPPPPPVVKPPPVLKEPPKPPPVKEPPKPPPEDEDPYKRFN